MLVPFTADTKGIFQILTQRMIYKIDAYESMQHNFNLEAVLS